MMAKEYELNTIMDFMAIPDDRLETLCAELPDMIRTISKINKRVDTAVQALSNGKAKGGVLNRGLVWVDDGEENIEVTIST